MGTYRKHDVALERRADGTLILRSAYDLGDVARCTGDWLDHWAQARPEAVFLAERSGPGWREVSYGETLERVQRIAGGLLARGMGARTPILILSGNSIDHALLTLAAQYVGVPTAPLAEPYSLIPAAERQLVHCASVVGPRMVFAGDGDRFAGALGHGIFAGTERVVSHGGGDGVTRLSALETTPQGVAEAAAKVGPDTVAKYLMTSGSTSSPKAVITPQSMLTANQAQIAHALPFLTSRPPRLVDWLPWNHVFGGSYTFNLVLSQGGSLYIDGGKPVRPLIDTTIENIRLMSATCAFNVPAGYTLLRDAMQADADLRRRFFEDLDMLFYAGASLPQEVWSDLESMARDVRDTLPLFTTSWGLTETAPGCLVQHEPAPRSGQIGVPMAGVEAKLTPESPGRYGISVRGPNIMPGYLGNAEKTAEVFDEEGFFESGDAVRFVDEADPRLGVRFDGRLSEDFKLQTGTWVRAANMRLEVLAHLAPLAQDLVLCGEGRTEIGALIFPSPDALALAEDGQVAQGAVVSAALARALSARLAAQAAGGSSMRVARALVLAEPPSLGEGEITAKGNLNFNAVLARRAALLARLYDDADASVIRG